MSVDAGGLTVHYIYHSGFTAEAGEYAFVFDYYRGGLNGAPPGAAPLPRPVSEYGHIAAFVSHVHPDHYNKAIFGWRDQTGLDGIRYVLSKDIERRAKRDDESGANVVFVDSGDTANVGGAVVRAFGSTDQGVSFLVDVPAKEPISAGGSVGARIFHAGDLNFWHWRDAASDDEIELAEVAFTQELSAIAAACAPGSIDVAFFPVDPRLGSDYYRGAVMFCEALRPKFLIPMHFGGRFDAPNEFFKEMEPLSHVVRVGEPGSRALPK